MVSFSIFSYEEEERKGGAAMGKKKWCSNGDGKMAGKGVMLWGRELVINYNCKKIVRKLEKVVVGQNQSNSDNSIQHDDILREFSKALLCHVPVIRIRLFKNLHWIPQPPPLISLTLLLYRNSSTIFFIKLYKVRGLSKLHSRIKWKMMGQLFCLWICSGRVLEN
ncbi:hypothetical protein L6452_05505 [Arctium lappa]|uniref:Uncharacterized protein n=1 Tax=Arctium lappa TaxID=4217 RepID=A0ACB9EGW3_ARCLA|nr:hypothetical protein L6452_05505 [Arctium lappa]